LLTSDIKKSLNSSQSRIISPQSFLVNPLSLPVFSVIEGSRQGHAVLPGDEGATLPGNDFDAGGKGKLRPFNFELVPGDSIQSVTNHFYTPHQL